MLRVSRKKMREWEKFAAQKGIRIKSLNLMNELNKCLFKNRKKINPDSRLPDEILTELFTLNNPNWGNNRYDHQL